MLYKNQCGDDKRKVLFIMSGILSLAYITFFCLNVSDLVVKHMEYEISYPLYVLLFSVLLFVVMLVINKIKHFDKKLFLIPLLFFISAIITFIVGYFTPCMHCTL